MVSKYKRLIVMTVVVLSCTHKALANPLQWYYGKAWVKAACAVVFGAYAKVHIDKKEQEKAEQTAPYTINLMWVNRDLKPEEPYMIQPKNKLVTEKYISAPCIWAIKNPESTVQLWFDSELTSPNAIAQTEKVIAERMKACPRSAPIVFKDIRELQHVKDHPEAFSSKTPVYFRADLLRVIAGYEEVKKTKNNFVYADFDVEPIRKKDLFDDLTKEYLSTYGMVMAHCDKENFENSFYILSPHEQKMLKSLESTLIDLNIKRADNALNGYYFFTKSIHPEIVFRSHRLTYAYLYHMQNRGLLKLDAQTTYDYDRHGLSAFGLDEAKRYLQFEIPRAGTVSSSSSKPSTDIYCRNTLWFPTKKVNVPPVSGDYDQVSGYDYDQITDCDNNPIRYY